MAEDDAQNFLNRLLAAQSVDAFRALADEAATEGDQAQRQLRLVQGAQVAPFFVPNVATEANISPSQLFYLVGQARQTAAQRVTPRVIVSAPMKSGSTFISDSISRAMQLPKVSLLMQMARAYDYTIFGAGYRPHEIDEMTLLAACLGPRGFVSHHHMQGSPYLAAQMGIYTSNSC